MSKVSLFEHNEKAYQKLIKSLENNSCTTINHATGTGKTFIALKYMYENRNKKILYLSPTYPIIDQLIESGKKIGIDFKDLNVDTMIYRNLQSKNMNELYEKYDVIIFDEYHRVGAKETYKKIKQLKLKLSQKTNGKKFIGLTATPIRYLDNERNMTQEIFDGNVASSIPLAEAMLEELLPVGIMINSKIACRPDLKSAVAQINKMAPTKEKEKLQKQAEKTDQQINNGVKDFKGLVNQYIQEKDGKYIIFCNNIVELENLYVEVDKWFEDIGPIKKYKVHSRIDIDPKEMGQIKSIKEKNRKTLAHFNQDKKGISVLLCVDILNEGVHVDGIDGIFMLRRTKSPIIYFQQIGRALSFSGRNKQIKIFDLVNNFNNHMAIDMVYQELHEEFERKIKEQPEKREKYEEILKRFKIMDETKQILKDIARIKEAVTTQKIIESKVEYAIELLTQYTKSGKPVYDLFTTEQNKKAYATIAKYYAYVNNKQFEQLLQLNILLPEELSMTREERLKLLNGYDTIKEKINAEYHNFAAEVIEFAKRENQLPSLEAEEEEEKKLAQRYVYGIVNKDASQYAELKQMVNNGTIKLKAWEKVIFDIRITRTDLNQIMESAQGYMNASKELPDYLRMTIEKITQKYNIEENAQLFKLLARSDAIKQERLEETQKIRYELINKIETYLREHVDDEAEKLNQTGIMGMIHNLRPRDRIYLKRKYEFFKQENYKKILASLGDDTLSEFCRKMKQISKEQIPLCYETIQQNEKINEFMMKLIEFIYQHEEKYPSTESQDAEEKLLAQQFNQYLQEEKTRQRFSLLIEDKENQFYNPKRMLYRLALEKKKQNEIKTIILGCVEFLQKNGRRPLPNSDDQEERRLAIDYEEKCIENLNNYEIKLLNSLLNHRKNFQKTCDAFIRNIQAKQGRDVTD